MKGRTSAAQLPRNPPIPQTPLPVAPGPACYSFGMSAAKTKLRAIIESLSDEQAERALALLGSDSEDVSSAWDAEIDRRVARALRGESRGISWDEARARAEARMRQG